MVGTSSMYVLVLFVGVALATPIIYDGRAPLNYTQFDFDKSVDPYLTWVSFSSRPRTS